MTRYTIRYQVSDASGKSALIVENEGGTAYVFSAGHLQVSLNTDDAASRLVALLKHQAKVARTSDGMAYSINELRQILDGADSPVVA